MMDYFCYISQGKVDQLYNSYNIDDADEWTESKTTENDFGMNAGADWSIARVINLFKGEISYGRKGIIQRERKVKLHYVNKLRQVLIAITKEQAIPALLSAHHANNYESRFYHYDGFFRISESLDFSLISSNKVVTVTSEFEGNKLSLDCSLRYFSEGNAPDGTFSIHSGNYRFFSGDTTLPLETVFLLLKHDNNCLIGTPLYLKLLLTRLENTTPAIAL